MTQTKNIVFELSPEVDEITKDEITKFFPQNF